MQYKTDNNDKQFPHFKTKLFYAAEKETQHEMGYLKLSRKGVSSIDLNMISK